uniref:Uncharacterized protein n=1 Tax=Cynoglossus semilaevis TaxID=244447 RepID=A0A3P8VSY2_CYNSE
EQIHREHWSGISTVYRFVQELRSVSYSVLMQERHMSSPPCLPKTPRPGGRAAQQLVTAWLRELAPALFRSLTPSQSVWRCPPGRPALTWPTGRRMAHPIRVRGL